MFLTSFLATMPGTRSGRCCSGVRKWFGVIHWGNGVRRWQFIGSRVAWARYGRLNNQLCGRVDGQVYSSLSGSVVGYFTGPYTSRTTIGE